MGVFTKWTSWAVIANTTTSLDYTNLTATTQYRAVVQSGSCLVANSSVATITVSPASNPGSITGPTTVCYGSGGILTVSGYIGSLLRWELSTDNGASWSNISNTSSTQAFDNLTSSTQYRVAVKSGACPEAVSPSALAITVNPTPAVGKPTPITLTSGVEPICELTTSSNNPQITTSYATTATNNEGFNWSISNTAAGLIDANGVMTWANNFSGTVAIRVTANGCNGPSAVTERHVTINPPFTPTVSITPGLTICAGDAVTLAASGLNTLGSVNKGDFNEANPAGWQVKENGTNIIFPANANNTDTNPWSETNDKTFNGIYYDSKLGGKFAIVNGAVNSTLETPIFNTVGRTSAALDFFQAFNLSAGTVAKIEISTNGGSTYAATLAQYNPPANFGTPAGPFTNVSIH
jgi:hypothetical protein